LSNRNERSDHGRFVRHGVCARLRASLLLQDDDEHVESERIAGAAANKIMEKFLRMSGL